MTQPFRNISVLLTANNTQLKSSLAQSSAAVNSFDNSVKKANTGLSQSGKLMAGALAGGALAAGAGLLYATNKAMALETAMRNVNSISGLTEEGLAALTAQVVNMSKVLPQSAEELAEGLYDIASSGFQGAEGMMVLDAAARSASAGMSTTAVAAKGITAVLNSYGLGAEDAADVSDVLFQTVNAGVITFEELAGSIGDVTGIAATAGVAVDELGAAYAAMTLQGVGGSESATLLTNIFSKMLKPSEALAGMMNELGYESGEAMLKANGLKGSMDLLREATGGSATAIFEIFPDIQAARGALALMADDGRIAADAWDKIADAENRAGATQRTLNEQMKSVSAQMTLAKNQFDAFAITVGLKVLPKVLQLIDGARVLGGELKDGLGTIVEALGPTWENLGEILGDVWEMLVQVGEAVGPLAGGFAKLAIGGVVITLNALTEVLSILTGVIAENEGLATLLAIALGITLLGGVGALATKIQVALVLALSNAIGALGAAAGAAAGLNGAMVAAAAGTAGVAAVLAGALVAWQGYRDGTNAAKDALEAFQTSSESSSLEDQVKGVQDLTADLGVMEDRLVELDSRGLLSDIFNVKAAGEELGLRRSIQEVAEAAGDAEQDLLQLQGAVVKYVSEAQGMSGIEAFEEFGTAEQGAQALADALPMLTKANVNVGDSFEVVKQKMDAYKRSQETGPAATEDAIAALGDLANEAKDTETAIDELKSAFDRLVGVFINSDQATIAFHDALRETAEAAKENGHALDLVSDKGGNNVLVIGNQVTKLLEQIEASARAGESSEELAAKMETGRKAILDTAEAAGYNRGEVEELINTYNLTPELVQTIVEAVGTQPTKEELAAIQAQLAAVDAAVATPEIRLVGMAAFEQNMITAEKAFARLSRVSVSGTAAPMGDGPGRGGPTLAKVSSLMEGIPGIRVSSTYRSPAQNRAVGGSPTSYHIDRANPAVDVSGPMSSLDRLASRARAKGGWRELLWRVPGHYDHVHFAATGGPISGPGSGTSDSIPAWLSNGEHVWTAKEVERAGGHNAVEGIRKQFRFATGGPVGFGNRQRQATDLTGRSAGDPNFGADRGYGPDLLGQVRGLTDVEQIRAATVAWNKYNAELDQAARRHELMLTLAHASADVQASLAKGISDEDKANAAERYTNALKAVQEFDSAAARQAQADAIDNLVTAMEKQAEAEEKALEAAKEAAAFRREKQDNKYELGLLSPDQYLKILDRRMADEVRFSDEWMALYREREQIMEEQVDAAEEMADGLKDALDSAADAQRDAFDTLNGLLDQEASLRARMAANERQHSERSSELRERATVREAQYYADQATALRNYQSEVERINGEQQRMLTERRDALFGWADLARREEQGWANTAGQLIDNARDQAETFTEWMDALAHARARGLSEEVIGALGLDDGPQALAQLAQLNNATEQEIANLNQAVVDRTALAAEQVAREQADGFADMTSALVDAQAAYSSSLAELQSQYLEEQRELYTQLQELQDQLMLDQAELATELAMLGSEQGRSYGEALEAGIRSTIPGIQAAVAAAVAATNALAAAQAALAAQQNAPPPSSTKPSNSLPGGSGSPFRRVGTRTRTYDSGGWLEPGYTLAYNGTGQRELVSTAQQLAAGGAGGGSIVINVNAPVFGVDELKRTITGAVEVSLTQRGTAATIAGSR